MRCDACVFNTNGRCYYEKSVFHNTKVEDNQRCPVGRYQQPLVHKKRRHSVKTMDDLETPNYYFRYDRTKRF